MNFKGIHMTIGVASLILIFFILIGVFPTTNVHTVVRHVTQPELSIQDQMENTALDNCWKVVSDAHNQGYYNSYDGPHYAMCVTTVKKDFGNK